MGSKKSFKVTPRVIEKQSVAPAPAPAPPVLEVVDYFPPGMRPKKLIGGAYDPYERPKPTGDTVRVKRPRTDLRQLSAWIKTKKEVEAKREGESGLTEKPRNR
jgi:hypothetical protein